MFRTPYSFVFIILYETDKTALNVSYPIVIVWNMFHTPPVGWTYNLNAMKVKYDDFTKQEHQLF